MSHGLHLLLLSLLAISAFALPNYMGAITAEPHPENPYEARFTFSVFNHGSDANASSDSLLRVQPTYHNQNTYQYSTPPLAENGTFLTDATDYFACSPEQRIRVFARADVYGNITEENERDNDQILLWTCNPNGTDNLPDLAVASFSIPRILVPGQQYDANLTIENIGTLDSPDSGFGIDIGGEIFERGLPGIPQGSFNTGSTHVSCSRLGRLLVTVTVDNLDLINEQNESNNIFRTFVWCGNMSRIVNSTSAPISAIPLTPAPSAEISRAPESS